MFQERLDKKGFTLIEVLVSMVVLGIVFVPLAGSFVNAIHANERAKITQQATTVAQSVMEDFKAEKFIDLETAYGTPTDGDWSTQDFPLQFEKVITSESGRKFKCVTTVNTSGNNVEDINNNYLKDIYTMESSSNCLFDAGEISDWAANKYKEEVGGASGYSVNQIKAMLYRVYVVNITETSGTVTVELETQYHSSLSSSYYLVDSNMQSQNFSVDLKNIFLYFTPNSARADQIIVNDTAGIKTNLYAIANGSGLSSYQLTNCQIDRTLISIKSNVDMILSTGVILTETEEDNYVTDEKDDVRRYSIDVVILNEDGTKQYATMSSTRGE